MQWSHESLKLDITTRDEISQKKQVLLVKDTPFISGSKKELEIAWKKLALGWM